MQELVEGLVTVVAGLDPVWIYAVVGALAVAEAAAFVGLFVPGETAILLGGLLAAQGQISIVVLLVVVIAGAVVGDAIGYEIGRRWGPRILQTRVMLRRQRTVDRAAAAMVRRGPAVVFVGRWVGALRAVVPAMAGMSRMPYRTFTLWNVLGGVTWAGTCALLGYLAGASLARLEQWMGTSSWVAIVVGALGLGVLGARRFVRRRAVGRADLVPQDALGLTTAEEAAWR